MKMSGHFDNIASKKDIVIGALTISMTYLVFGTVWIYFSDRFVEQLADTGHFLTLLQTYKGWFFIFITTFLLFVLSYAFLNKQYMEYKTHHDEQRKAQKKLDRYNTLLNTIVDNSPDAIFAKDINGKYLLFNEFAAKVVGSDTQRVIGNTDEVIFSSKTVAELKKMDEAILRQDTLQKKEEKLTTSSGEEKLFSVIKGPVKNKEGKVLGLFGISRDITEERKQQKLLTEEKERFDYAAHHDMLTGLPNELSLIEQTTKKCQEGKPFAFMFIDLDAFKEINDSFGHGFGDKLLMEIRMLLEKVFPKEAYIVRTGGDEFVVLMECSQTEDLVTVTTQKLIAELKRAQSFDDNDIYITASIGVAFYPKDANNYQELLQKSDTAMYDAKKRGKNTYSFYDAKMTQNALYKTQMTTNLKKALELGELTVYFQPQIDPKTEKVIGLESLLRWFAKEGPISPGVFIPIAEETHLIIDIGEFVLKESLRLATEWRHSALFDGRVAVNVSARQLKHPGFFTTLETILHETECDPKWIELEITESLVLENPEKMMELLTKLQEKGFNISMDDFGTGYSSMAYLKNLPINKLKIDRSFISNVTQEEKNQTIVRTMIALAKGLKLKVLAEGVETSEELEFVKENQIDAVQGFYYYKPMNAAQTTQLLQQNRNV